LVLFLIGSVSSADHYVRVGATGTNDGSSWINAWKEFDQINWNSVSPGDTIYIAGGKYNSELIVNKDGAAGNILTIKRATDSDHGTAIDWNSVYDSQVQLSRINLFHRNYVTIDGSTWNGIKISQVNYTKPPLYLGAVVTNPSKYITLRNIEMVGPGYMTCIEAAGVRVFGTYTGVDNLVIDRLNVHEIPGVGMRLGDHNNAIIENSAIWNIGSASEVCPPNVDNGTGSLIPCSKNNECLAINPNYSCGHGNCVNNRPVGTPLFCSQNSDCPLYDLGIFSCQLNFCVVKSSVDYQDISCNNREDCPDGRFSCYNNKCVYLDVKESTDNTVIKCISNNECGNTINTDCVLGLCVPERPHQDHIALYGTRYMNNITVRNNFFYQKYSATRIRGIGLAMSSIIGDIDVYNNVFWGIVKVMQSGNPYPENGYLNFYGNTVVGFTSLYLAPTDQPIRVKNNIYCNLGFEGEDARYPYPSSTSAIIDDGYNLFCANSGYSSGHASTDTELPAGLDPFVDRDNMDFRLINDSRVLGKGTNLDLTYAFDIDGNVRSGTWDVGAYEYVGETIPASYHKADLDEDYRINITEVGLFINVWLGSYATLSEVINAIRIWSHGECYNENVCGSSATAFVNNLEEEEEVVAEEEEVVEEVVAPEVSGDEVLWLKFDGDFSDFSRNGNDAVKNGDVSFVSGHSGEAVSFDGDGDRLTVSLPTMTEKTISFWAKFDLHKAYNMIYEDSVGDYAGFNHERAMRLNWLDNSGENVSYIHVFGAETGSWNHYVVVYDLGGDDLEIRFYRDGVLFDEKGVGFNGLVGNSITSIGARNDGTHSFAGDIDDFRIWDRALGEEEILRLG